jgi:hypothetical protein
MAQDPDLDGEQPEDQIDPSHEMDMVPVFRSSGIDAEMEATNIHLLLQASGIPAILVGNSTLPVFEFQVHVSRDMARSAEERIEEARAAGPAAAAEAESGTE